MSPRLLCCVPRDSISGASGCSHASAWGPCNCVAAVSMRSRSTHTHRPTVQKHSHGHRCARARSGIRTPARASEGDPDTDSDQTDLLSGHSHGPTDGGQRETHRLEQRASLALAHYNYIFTRIKTAVGIQCGKGRGQWYCRYLFSKMAMPSSTNNLKNSCSNTSKENNTAV